MSILGCCSITMDIMCIYKIYNDVNSKIYIGSTTSLNLRKWYHLRDLKEKKHCNYKLQSDFNKGVDLKFEIVEHVDNSLDLFKREQYYMDLLKPKYNIVLIAGSKKAYYKHTKNKKKNNKRKNQQAEFNIALNYPYEIK